MFPLYKGIQQFYLEENIDFGTSRDKDDTADTTGYTNRDEKLVRQLRCSKKWPSCLFDFTSTRTLHDFFVFQARSPSPEKNHKSMHAVNSCDILDDDSEEIKLDEGTSYFEDNNNLRRFITTYNYV